MQMHACMFVQFLACRHASTICNFTACLRYNGTICTQFFMA
ncbi:hypothetical protein FOQG_03327 [Fusarium oxysporum f. sp. raphani 54005]|uniref:Uncharacterized protein n=3 Tax=Fusarium oxysporum TaxID=5507 RepID=X0CP67_FUSOX|nr:hypothetical protein FOVG_00406 [Fusarium oxysporum f. sp. pisi HDV247]EXK96210.1 hypothetical protein FOQG_03327 [Fusarium oxysporum f. sp. raphani 54005]EXM30425.1 hypothetical protein FOTG_04405 [Fusarium oxysporum f. sp. vasinfectum 25433]